MSEHIYTPSSTDITIRWRKLYNYVPASEIPEYQKKWSEFRALCAKGVESLEPAEALVRLERMRRVK